MHFLVDAQLPPALATRIQELGHHAQHVHELDLGGSSDRLIWDQALASNAAILTKDEDFAIRKAVVPDGPTIIWIRIGNTRKQQLLDWFGRKFSYIIQALETGEGLIEIT